MVATNGIADAAQIDPSYSPCGASVHPYATHGFLGSRGISIGSSVFHPSGDQPGAW